MRTFSFLILFFSCLFVVAKPVGATQENWWQIQAIDTMKYSRDPSREFLSKPAELQKTAELTSAMIASSGATHIALGTPYDEEFLPVLTEWAQAARAHGLSIWFRGNWSGWEQWFEYPPINREQHLQKTVAFITDHPQLFQEGDYFTACPECENGGPGDPRITGDIEGHRNFLIAEHQAILTAFRSINRNVGTSLNSMNGDVAKLVMDPATTQALGGLVVVDHYVRSPEQLDADITAYAERSGGKVMLGEFGAPIPDIHGNFNEAEQAEWVEQSLRLLARNPNLIGLNYWTSMGGSTSLWSDSFQAKQGVKVVQKYFRPNSIRGTVRNTLGEQVKLTTVGTQYQTAIVKSGEYELSYLESDEVVTVSAPGYETVNRKVSDLIHNSTTTLIPTKPSWVYTLRVWFSQLWPL